MRPPLIHKVEELAYIGIEVSDLEGWSTFATRVLGLEVTRNADGGGLYFRMDDHHHRFLVQRLHNGSDDVSFVGWQLRDAEGLDAVADRVNGAGISLIRGTPEEASQRRVIDFVHFIDPHTGIRMELSYGPEITFWPPFHPARSVAGFVTGPLGMGHVVGYVPDADAAEHFYTGILGFRCSDIGVLPGRGKVASFMYCNPRHHSFAFFQKTNPQRRVNHVMLEYSSIDDVGSALDVCKDMGLVRVELGRHNNDRSISFYAENPSGWLFELAWGARTIDPESFAVEHYTIGDPRGGHGEWGHEGLRTIV